MAFLLRVLFVKSGQAKFLLALPVKKVGKTGRAKTLFFSFYRQKYCCAFENFVYCNVEIRFL